MAVIAAAQASLSLNGVGQDLLGTVPGRPLTQRPAGIQASQHGLLPAATAPVTPASSLLDSAYAAYTSGAYTRALALAEDCLATSHAVVHTHARMDGAAASADSQSDVCVLLLAGACAYMLGRFVECIHYNQRAVAVDPSFAESFGNMGNALKELGRLPEAVAAYTKALALRPGFTDVYNNLASAYVQLGDVGAAVEMYVTCLNLNPGMVDAWSNLGNVYKAQGRMEEARRCYLEALRLRPSFAYAWANLAGLMRDCGNLSEALANYEEALRLQPDLHDAWASYGNALRECGRIADAKAAYERALALNPSHALVHGNLGSCLYDLGDVRGAIAAYRTATQLQPNSPDCLNNLGNAYREIGQLDESIVCYRTALSLHQAHPHAWNNLGNSLKDKGFVKEAITCYTTACRLLPNFAAGHSNLASVLKEQGQVEAAIAHYYEALRIDPDFADAWSNLGNAMKDVGRVDDAVRCYSTAIVLKPTFADAFSNLASAYKDGGRVEDAIGCYSRALELKPHFPDSFANLVHSLVLICDWRTRQEDFATLTRMLSVQITAILGPDPWTPDDATLALAAMPALADAAARAMHTQLPAVQPFHSLVYPMSLRQMQRLAQCYALRAKPNVAALGVQPFVHSPRAPGARLRIGYVSSDFGNHPLSHLMQSVFGMHSRSAFDVFCYSLSPDDGSVWRRKISSEVEHFIDVSRMSYLECAQRIHADGIHVLVNLNGYTKGARNEIFALQPAPIQVNYMGFCGTLGADYVQYMVVDRTVVPEQFERYYTEALVHMPHSYFVNDHKQSARDVLDKAKLPKRAAYGIPEDKFVFANFNQIYKLDPATFRVWCRILLRCPDAVLWLLRFPSAGEVNIRLAARAFGVPDDRIIFTDVAPKDEHIRRGTLCDVFLDTPVCNAHTTGCDILWAGVPVITLPGEKLASRVAASLLVAAGASECIVSSLPAYEELAVKFAQSPALARSLRARLEAWRESCPLFDTQRWVRNFERALRAMWKRHELGLGPASIVLDEADSGDVAATAAAPAPVQRGAGGQPHVPISWVSTFPDDPEAQHVAAVYANTHAPRKARALLGPPLRPCPATAASLLAAGVVVPGLEPSLPVQPPMPHLIGSVSALPMFQQPVLAPPLRQPPLIMLQLAPAIADAAAASRMLSAQVGSVAPSSQQRLMGPPGGVPMAAVDGGLLHAGMHAGHVAWGVLPLQLSGGHPQPAMLQSSAAAMVGVPRGWNAGLWMQDMSAYVMAPAHVAQSGLSLAAIDPRALIAQPAVSPLLHIPSLIPAGVPHAAIPGIPGHPALAGISLLSATVGRAGALPLAAPAASTAAGSTASTSAAALDPSAARHLGPGVSAPIPLAVHQLALHSGRQEYLKAELAGLQGGFSPHFSFPMLSLTDPRPASASSQIPSSPMFIHASPHLQATSPRSRAAVVPPLSALESPRSQPGWSTRLSAPGMRALRPPPRIHTK